MFLNNKVDCFMGDLTHTKQGIQAKCFPLGIGLVAEYAKQELGDMLNIELYKYPEELEKSCKKHQPKILSLSNYAWNQELAFTFIKAYKLLNKDAIIIVGGPNFPYSSDERKEFLLQNDFIDFYIFGEGEIGFVEILKELISNDYDIEKIKSQKKERDNCSYIYQNKIYSGSYVRIKNIKKMPSPYLNGSFDKYFDEDLIPLYETTRGCPFSCTFCSDGVKYKSNIYRHSQEEINKNLEYIAINKKQTDSLILSDLNFGMYENDIKTCEKIAQTKDKYNFPIFFSASAGKSKFENILKSVKLLDGSWFVGASVQSTDEDVLKNIKRKNLSHDKMIALANSTKEKGSVSYTEIILALPQDSKEKHFKSLQMGVDAGLNSIKMYQLMLLVGTEMSSKQSMDYYEMVAKYRVMPGAAGVYDFFDKEYKIAEFEKIVVANNTLSYQDYIDCRLMNLIVEIFINNAMFSEFYLVLELFNISKFDTLRYIKNHNELYTLQVNKIFDSFIKDTEKDLYDTYEEIVDFVQADDIINHHITGELGNNEITDHKALSYLEYKDFMELLYNAVICILKEKELHTEVIDNVLMELKRFIIIKNSDFKNTQSVFNESFHYDFSNRNFQEIINSKNSSFEYRFYHTDEQKSIISSLYKTYYGDTLAGLGRLIQRNNLNVLYRKFQINKT